MPCYYPRRAWRSDGLGVSFREPAPEAAEKFEVLSLPCGGCVGCRVRKARDWSVRCLLEDSRHSEACWVTLTYDDEHLPPDGLVRKAHVSGWLKRVRARLRADDRKLRKYARTRGDSLPPWRSVRFFACGEYGEQTKRPHYHAILWGVSDSPHFQEAWPYGFARRDPLTPEAISYVAGYVGKKIGDAVPVQFESYYYLAPRGKRLPVSRHKKVRVAERDESGRITAWADENGEVLMGPVPVRRTVRRIAVAGEAFLLMSRRPGIGSDARRFAPQWKESAIFRGNPVPVPRYLHEAYKLTASEEEYARLEEKKRQDMSVRLQLENRFPQQVLQDGEANARALLALKNERRSL